MTGRSHCLPDRGGVTSLQFGLRAAAAEIGHATLAVRRRDFLAGEHHCREAMRLLVAVELAESGGGAK